VDALLRAEKIPPASRSIVEKYFSLYTPKALIEGGGFVTYTANTRGIEEARTAALAQCQQKIGRPCRTVLENFSPAATSSR
jgi:hypothetical protein